MPVEQTSWSQSLPFPALYGGTALLAVLIGWVVFRVAESRSSRFLALAIWMRCILSAHHQTTFRPLLAGLSGNAVGSIALLAAGLLTINKRLLLQAFFVPFYLMIAVIVVSGLISGEISGLITAATKYGYMLVIAAATYEALGRSGDRAGLPPILWGFAPLLVFQVLSILLGVVKAGEADGSASYIGGYNHEATFSVSLAACLVMACFAAEVNKFARNGLILACIGGIYLSNYRTTIIAVAPVLIVYFGLPDLSALKRNQQALVRFAVLLVAAGALAVAVWFLQTRMADLSTAFNSGPLIKDPYSFSPEDKRLLSGRPYIWSVFIYGYANGGFAQHLIGFGPESWEKFFAVYPHNTLVSYLYEYGVVGVTAIVIFWVSMIAFAFRIRTDKRNLVVAAHVSFFILNMATMPLWQIEGNIFYGLLCGYTLYQRQLGDALLKQRAPAPDQRLAAAGFATPRQAL